MPENRRAFPDDDDFLFRDRDCAVINTLFINLQIANQTSYPFDTVRGAFCEG